MHRAHRFDRNSCFYDTVSADHSKMDLPISGHRFFKNRSPINVPTGEDSACITCDGEQESLSMHRRQSRPVMEIRHWSVFREKLHRILTDFEAATGLRFSRVAFCFSFHHSWKTVAQI